jgi:diaminopimelate decarboxylase
VATKDSGGHADDGVDGGRSEPLDAGAARELVAVHGSPLFVYRREVVAARIRALRGELAALPLTLRYAVKANPCPALLAALPELVDSLDVASGGELRAGLDAGFDGGALAFAGPGKGEDEHRAALEAGAAISVESLGELERLLALAADQQPKAPSTSKLRLRFRVNPREAIHAYGLRTGGGASPFGIDEELLLEAATMLSGAAASERVVFEGLHVHAGSQCFSAAALARSFGQTLAIARRFEQQTGLPCRVVNLGGGLGHGAWRDAKQLDLADLCARLGKLWREHISQLGADNAALAGERRLELEPGRWLVGPAGSYLCRVLDVKDSCGERFVVVDGGMHQLFAATGVYGPTPARLPLLRNVDGETEQREPQRCTVVGRLCTPLDRLAEGIELPEPRVGDLLCFDEVGAYGPSASPQGFLSHAPATEIVS